MCQSKNTTQVCTWVMPAWVYLHFQCSRTRVLQGTGQVQPGRRAAAFGEHVVCMSCEELRMDMGVNLCVSALKFNINCSDENQSCWILLNFLLRKKIPLLFFFSLKTQCSHIIIWGGKTHRLQQILGVKLTVKKKKGTEAEKQIFKIPLFGIRTQKDSLLVCSFFRSARTMIGCGNSTVSAGNLSTCQVTHDEFLWLEWI